MLIVIATISIFVLTGVVWVFNKVLPIRFPSGQELQICPICAGVSGTWILMLAAKFLGYPIDALIPAMLMGGSVVGIAYQLEKKLPPNRSTLLWKTLFIPVGFVAAFGLVSFLWVWFFAAAALLLAISFLFLKAPRSAKEKGNKRVDELERKMKDECC